MIDTQQKFINLYVDKAVGMLHEYLSIILQLRTQLQLANDLIQEKDQVIASFNTESEKVKSESTNLNQELEQTKANARQWEEQFNAMKSKVSHMDTLTNQYNEMKNGLIAKNEEVSKAQQELAKLQSELKLKNDEIDRLNNVIEELKIPVKKVINSKKEKSTKSESIIPDISNEIDDF